MTETRNDAASAATDGSTLSGKWSISTNEELYHGTFDTVQDAIEEGKADGNGVFWVGQCMAPAQPETLFDEWDVERWIERSVWEHDDYMGEWAEGSFDPSREQMEDLATDIRPVIAAWIDRHGLRPTHWNIDPASVRKIDA